MGILAETTQYFDHLYQSSLHQNAELHRSLDSHITAGGDRCLEYLEAGNSEIVLKAYRVLEPMAEIYTQIRSLIEEDRCGIVKKGMRVH